MTDERQDYTSPESGGTPPESGNAPNTPNQGPAQPFDRPPYGAGGSWQSTSYSGSSYYGGGGYGTPSPAPEGKGPKKPNRSVGWIIGLALLYVGLIGGIFALIATGTLRFGFVAEETNQTVEVGEKEKGERETYAPIEEVTLEDGSLVLRNEDHSGEALTATELYEKNVESVVFVVANYRNGISTGSGFVIDAKSGYILTNYHVVEDCEDISVSFVSEKAYKAELVGGDEINDVAVLKVDAEGLRAVNTTNSDHLRVGSDVIIIGNPLGDLTFTMTRGIVSAVNRKISTGEYNIRTFQTDTAINSGNSGGPAFNAAGEVIGIASAKYSAAGVEGIGFCIPINDAMAVARDLIAYGYVTGRPNFGIAVSDSYGYEYSIDQHGRPVRVEVTKGARVEEVGKDSCAEKAGLKVGDIITKIDDTKIETANALINAKTAYKAGDTVKLEVYRDGETLTLTVVFDEYTP
ncbi:MAG: trypsin-like peptidase domain-containing protein [Clostridia bacterium]|nr:trypsin-like peptidase domain-containing protein [Clostridia bacterium]